MGKIIRSRGWFMTLWDVSAERVTDLRARFDTDDKCEYAVCGRELTPNTNKPHLHVVAYYENAISMKGLMKKIDFKPGEGQLETKRGTHTQASDYVEKDGDIAFVVGTIPTKEDTPKSAWDYILDMVEAGATDTEIMREYPAQFARCYGGIGNMRMSVLADELNCYHPVEVTYLWGGTGSGKTRSVLDGMVEHPRDVFRVTDYKHPFDNYRGQKVLMFEEFRSSLPIEQMLNYLDCRRMELPCRYANKVSGWDTIYLVTNVSPDSQYPRVQEYHPETWAAWERRIHHTIRLE
jgi:hypothetical protein